VSVCVCECVCARVCVSVCVCVCRSWKPSFKCIGTLSYLVHVVGLAGLGGQLRGGDPHRERRALPVDDDCSGGSPTLQS
jgi:hypothetical protein